MEVFTVEVEDILESPFVKEMVEVTTNMYNHGWDERNGGNSSRSND